MANQGVANCKIQPDGFLSIELHHSDCAEVIERLKSRIRMLSHQEHRGDNTDAKTFLEISALARMGFGLAKYEKLVNLSQEDGWFLLRSLESAIDGSKVSFIRRALGALGFKSTGTVSLIRRMGDADPVWNDGLAKDVQSIMEG